MKVGFIGLGRMGAAMAQNIQAAGHHLAVNDVRREACDPLIEAGATYLGTAREIAAQSDIIVISVPGPGFGNEGEGFIRFSGFISEETTHETLTRIKEI